MVGAGGNTRRRKLRWITVGLIATVVAVALLFPIFKDWDSDRETDSMRESFKYPAVKTICSLVSLVEKPDARRVYLADSDATTDFVDFFNAAGCVVATNAPDGRYDIVFAEADNHPSFDNLAPLVAERGILACLFDSSDMTIADMKTLLDSFPAQDAHLWMPGESTWLLAGRITPRKVKLSAMLDVFAWEGLFDTLAAASCYGIKDAFASYAGDRSVIEPALKNLPPGMPLAPEILTTQSPPDIEWIVEGDIDDDILGKTARDIREVQSIRRQVLKGNILSKAGQADDAIEQWHLAFLRNPNDTLLLERLYRLAVNARACREIGNMKTAAKCYETMICINPKDTLAISEYASCLRSVGQFELADEAMKRAEELRSHEEK